MATSRRTRAPETPAGHFARVRARRRLKANLNFLKMRASGAGASHILGGDGTLTVTNSLATRLVARGLRQMVVVPGAHNAIHGAALLVTRTLAEQRTIDTGVGMEQVTS